MKQIFVMIFLAFLLTGCVEEIPENKEVVQESGNKECDKDSDCKISGCNGEICAKEKMMSICVYKPEFECYKTANCGCIDGKCGWEQTKEFLECLESHN